MSDNLGLLDQGEVRVRLFKATSGVDDLDLFEAGSMTRILPGVDAGAIPSFTDREPGSVEIRASLTPAPAGLSNLKVEADQLYTFIVTGTARALELVQIADLMES